MTSKSERAAQTAEVTLAKRYVPTSEPQPGEKYIRVKAPALPKLEPRYVGVDPETVHRLAARRRPQPRRPLVDDDDPAFASRLAQLIRQIEAAVARIAHMTSARPSPPGVDALQRAVRAALDDYLAHLPGRVPRGGA